MHTSIFKSRLGNWMICECEDVFQFVHAEVTCRWHVDARLVTTFATRVDRSETLVPRPVHVDPNWKTYIRIGSCCSFIINRLSFSKCLLPSSFLKGELLYSGYDLSNSHELNRLGYTFASILSTCFVLFWQGEVVGRYRRAANVPYPQAYAEKAEAEASLDAKRFNCAQRAHQNTLENVPIIFAL